MITALEGVGAVVLGAMLLLAAHDLVRRPAFRRLAIRNLVRRRSESVLVIVGSSLGTAIIAAAFLVGAGYHASVRDVARTELGPIDEEVLVGDAARLAEVTDAVAVPPLRGVDGVLPTVRAPLAVTAAGGEGSDRRAEPAATVAELDVAAATAFGGRPADTGFDGVVPPDDSEVLVGSATADTLGVSPGDVVTLHGYGTSIDRTVAAVVDPVGVAGAQDVVVAPGTLTAMASDRPEAAAEPSGIVLVSNDGGVFDGASATGEVTAGIRARTGGRFDVEIADVKADRLAEAEGRGRTMGQLFTGVGTFSVLAGLLLLVNLFVMMAEERKRALGLARAMGLERWHLVRVFTLEGVFYSLGAAVLGCAMGIGVAWLVIRSAAGLIEGPGFTLRFVAPSGVLVGAGVIGLGLSMATVWITSLRIANLDIIRALRDLPELPRRRHELRSSLPAGIGVGVGIGLGVWGLLAIEPLAVVLGPPLALCCAIPLGRPLVGRRFTVGFASVGTLVWCIAVFTFMPRIIDHTGIGVYVVQGIVMVAAAVGLATALDRSWLLGTGLLTRTGKGLAARLGLAYPLDKVFRTALLVGMYALIIFTLTFVAVYGKVTTNRLGTITNQVALGADVLVDANPSDPPSPAAIGANDGVADVRTVWRAAPQFTVGDGTRPTTWPTSGMDEPLLARGRPHLTERAARFATDGDVFRALLEDPGLIVVDKGFGDTTGLSASAGEAVGVGTVLHAHDPVSGNDANFEVVGVTGADLTGAGSWMSTDALRSLAGPAASPTRFYVGTAPGADPGEIAAMLDAELVRHGVDATAFSELVSDSMAVELGFLSLMQRYMAIGLVVGIAGLAVVMVRSARERRRQIGMLRVIGFPHDTVRGAFLVEAVFISGQGIATGIGLGLLFAYQMLSRAAALGGERLPYAVPWPTIGLLAVLPFLASVAVALIPAAQASSVEPAEVLRLAE